MDHQIPSITSSPDRCCYHSLRLRSCHSSTAAVRRRPLYQHTYSKLLQSVLSADAHRSLQLGSTNTWHFSTSFAVGGCCCQSSTNGSVHLVSHQGVFTVWPSLTHDGTDGSCMLAFLTADISNLPSVITPCTRPIQIWNVFHVRSRCHHHCLHLPAI